MTGEVAILNVGEGDTKLTFNSKDPAEVIRAGRIVKDMLRRGYALLVDLEGDGNLTRALDFDENTNEYIIADLDPVREAEEDAREQIDQAEAPAGEPSTKGKTGGTARRGGRPRKRITAKGTRATAVAPVAGG